MTIRRSLIPALFAFALCAQAQPAGRNRSQFRALPPATYSKEVARVIQGSCLQCHRTGDIAPFPLETYDDVVTHASAIQRALATRIMPPWKPDAGYGNVRDSFQISEQDRAMLLNWLASGMPQGDAKDLPATQPTRGEWPLGEPDVKLQMPVIYTPPVGQDVYRCFVISPGVPDAAYLSAIDVLPGSRKTVHHVLLFQDTSGAAEKIASPDGQPGYPCFGGPGIEVGANLNMALGGWAPGQRTHLLPDGVAIELQKGAKIIMQVHYHPHGFTEPDQTRLGLYITRKPVERRLFQVPIVQQRFTIPAGAEKHEVNASFTIPTLLDAKGIWIYPHMHLLGQEIQVDVAKRDGSTLPLIRESAWDFNYQGSYTFAEPPSVRAGDTIRLRCTFDNSDRNRNNPNSPPKPVSWGEATTDEMCLAFVGVTFDFEPLLRQFLP